MLSGIPVPQQSRDLQRGSANQEMYSKSTCSQPESWIPVATEPAGMPSCPASSWVYTADCGILPLTGSGADHRWPGTHVGLEMQLEMRWSRTLTHLTSPLMVAAVVDVRR